jgi:hypothetical protein
MNMKSAVSWIALFALFIAAPSSAQLATNTPAISLKLSVRTDGTASPLWTAGTAVAIGEEAATDLAGQDLLLTEQAEAWFQVLTKVLPTVEERCRELATLFDVAPMDAIVVAGNRGSSDGFAWVPNFIGINVQAFADAYGPPEEGAADRMVRITAHEYLHLLSYAFYPNHRDLRRTPLDRALWTMFFEGIGDYVSVSSRWFPDEEGNYSTVAAETLQELEPIFVERLEKLATASEEGERELRAGIAMGRFDEKWGSLPFALWLHREVKQCGEAQTLRAMLRLERDGVLSLALRHASPELLPRITVLQEVVGRTPDAAAERSAGCLASSYSHLL